jgi:hypothetical protein
VEYIHSQTIIPRAVDPDSLNTDPDPAFQVNPDPQLWVLSLARVLMTKNISRKIQMKNFLNKKIAIYSCPSYRRRLQPEKGTSVTTKNEIY